jgi:hypothetical protein
MQGRVAVESGGELVEVRPREAQQMWLQVRAEINEHAYSSKQYAIG